MRFEADPDLNPSHYDALIKDYSTPTATDSTGSCNVIGQPYRIMTLLSILLEKAESVVKVALLIATDYNLFPTSMTGLTEQVHTSNRPSNNDNEEDPTKYAILTQIEECGALSIASRTRQSLSQESASPVVQENGIYDCQMVERFSGSFNVAFKLEFEDGQFWLLKIPFRAPDQWTEAAAAAVTTEVMVMRMLKRETTIPVPTVYSYDATIQNEAGWPHILMEFIEGVTLAGLWNDHTIPKK